jgi:hypothetical protein
LGNFAVSPVSKRVDCWHITISGLGYSATPHARESLSCWLSPIQLLLLPSIARP